MLVLQVSHRVCFYIELNLHWDYFLYSREAFQCRVLLCIWHARHSWIRRILKTCCNFDVQREVFKQLGWLLYSTRSGSNAMDVVEEFMQVFVDQCAFMDYFKRRWLPNLGIFLSVPDLYA